MRMDEWIPLQRLLVQPAPGRTVGRGETGERLGHTDLVQQAQAWCDAFAAVPGQDWALYFDDALRFAAALFGAWHAGKRVYLAADNLPATLEALQPHVSGFAGDIDPQRAPRITASDIPARDRAPLQALDERRCELVVFTSGSTGEPSAIVKRLDQLAREVDALQSAFGAEAGGAQVQGTVSHQHIYGLLFRVLWPLAAGQAIQPRRFFHEDLLGALAAAESVLVATPAHLKRLPEQLDWARVRGRLRAVFSSGGPLPAEAAARVRDCTGVAPIEVYGSSETGGIAWRRWTDAAPPWQPLPGVRWRIDEGRLVVASAHLATAAWWPTQDRVDPAPGGCFRLLGRADRIVKIEERRVSLDALERALRDDPEVDDARVLVVAGERDRLGAVLVPTDATLVEADEATRRRFQQRVAARLAQRQDAVTRPRRWRLLRALPLNAQGKVTQAALLSLFEPRLPAHQWVRREPAAAALRITLAPTLRVFEGHFEQTPILPGVAQLDWAIQFARGIFPLPPRFLRLDALKFQHVARPGDELTLQLDWDAGRDTLGFRYTSLHGVHASGKVLFSHD